MKRGRDEAPLIVPAAALQRIVEDSKSTDKSGPKAHVLNSPYGPSRNEKYGWGDLFHQPTPAIVSGYEDSIHIGISSLNAVPGKGSDRSMRRLLSQYRRVFSCLEHCYPYHHVSDAETWASWADMVRGPTQATATATTTAQPIVSPHAASAVQEARPADTTTTSTTPHFTTQASRFQFTIKANKSLTHEKLLATEDPEVAAHVRLFFNELCPRLDPFLGPVLLQLPPSFQCSPANLARLEALDAMLPKDEIEIEYPATPTTPTTTAKTVVYRRRRVRIAVEFRHRSWFHEETFRALRRLGWGLVAAHHNDDPTFATPIDTGVPFLYVRLHGALGRYVGEYGPVQMDLWAERLVHFLRSQPHTSASASATAAGQDTADSNSAPLPAPGQPPREVFVFLNNSDSHVAGVTSSTVDARYLASVLQRRLAKTTQTLPASTLVADVSSRSDQATAVVNVDDHSTSIMSMPSLVIEDSSGAIMASQPSVCELGDDGAESDVVTIHPSSQPTDADMLIE